MALLQIYFADFLCEVWNFADFCQLHVCK